MSSKVIKLRRVGGFAIESIEYEVAVLVNEASYSVDKAEPRVLIELETY